MPAPSKNQVYLYNTRDEIESKSVPYAIEDAEVLERVISRFLAWPRMVPRYPDVAAKCGTAHIHPAADLRAVVKASRENHLYPKIVLPISKYFSATWLTIYWISSAADIGLPYGQSFALRTYTLLFSVKCQAGKSPDCEGTGAAGERHRPRDCPGGFAGHPGPGNGSKKPAEAAPCLEFLRSATEDCLQSGAGGYSAGPGGSAQHFPDLSTKTG